jgi:predicted dienelactone hydrolase
LAGPTARIVQPMRAPSLKSALVLVAIDFSGLAGCDRRPNPVFILVRDHGRTEARLETYLYAPEAAGRWPVVLLSHGSSGGAPKQSIDWSTEAAYFTSKGYVVFGTDAKAAARARETRSNRKRQIATCHRGIRGYSPPFET